MALLTITQIAQKLGKSRQWIWFLIRTGQLKAEKVGNQFVVDSENLKQYQSTINPSKNKER